MIHTWQGAPILQSPMLLHPAQQPHTYHAPTTHLVSLCSDVGLSPLAAFPCPFHACSPQRFTASSRLVRGPLRAGCRMGCMTYCSYDDVDHRHPEPPPHHPFTFLGKAALGCPTKITSAVLPTHVKARRPPPGHADSMCCQAPTAACHNYFIYYFINLV